MAYRSEFDFDGNDPGPGGFFFKLFDSGKVMVGWGRPRRSKWAQLDQAEIVNFLANAAQMLVTDDEVVKGLLESLADRLTVTQELTLATLPAAATEHIQRYAALLLEGRGSDEALKVLNAEIRDAA